MTPEQKLLPPKVLITREGDPPYLAGGVVRANGYASMSFEQWRDFDPSVQLASWKQEVRDLLERARACDAEKAWDSARHPEGYIIHSMFFGGFGVVVPLEMLLDD